MDPAIAKLRLKHMTAWDVDPKLCEEDIDLLLLVARREDSDGYTWDSQQWVPSFDLPTAAAEAWAWKAGASVDRYRVVSDNTDLNRQQVHSHCLNMEKLYRRRSDGRVHSIRMRGQLIDDRSRVYSATPWWWALSA